MAWESLHTVVQCLVDDFLFFMRQIFIALDICQDQRHTERSLKPWNAVGQFLGSLNFIWRAIELYVDLC